jgi:hypothetical protein
MSSIKFLLNLALLCSPAFLPSIHAQTWQWAHSGGGINDNNLTPNEAVKTIATDKNGNVYAMSRIIGGAPVKLGANTVSLAAGQYSNVLFSYRCDGSFRWAKQVDLDANFSLATDTVGGVYVAGVSMGNTFYMGSLSNQNADTTWNNNKCLVLIKLDTLGNKQWIRTPQPDTAAISTIAYSIDLDVEPNGNVHWFCGLPRGNYEGNALIVSSYDTYIMRYSNTGTLTGNTLINIFSSDPAYTPGFLNMKMKYSSGNNRYLLSGSYWPGDPTLMMGTTNVTSMLFLACYDATGGVQWVKQSGQFCMNHGKPAVDKSNNIYIAASLGHGNTFNGFTQQNLYTTITHNVAFLQKMDANGNALWTRGSSGSVGNYLSNVILTDTTVTVAGSYGSKYKWNNGNDSFSTQFATTAVNIFLTRFKSGNGDYLKTDTISSTNSGFEYPYSLASDRFGNYYVGGDFETNLQVGTDYLVKNGGSRDFFIGKYGSSNCSKKVEVSVTDVFNNGNHVSVYPNPTNDVIMIQNNSEQRTIHVYDMSGRVIATNTLAPFVKQVVSLQHYPPGIYIMKLTTENGQQSFKKIVKE